MKEKPENPPAFSGPITVSPGDINTFQNCQEFGVSLRDYFAGQALAGVVFHQLGEPQLPNDSMHRASLRYANAAFAIADAMLAARSK